MERVKLENGEIRYREKVRLLSGRMQTRTFRTAKSAEQWKREQEVAKERGELGLRKAKRTPLKKVAEQWFAVRIKNQKAQKTEQTYRVVIDCHVNPMLGDLFVEFIDRSTLDSFVEKLVAKGKRPGTINRILGVLLQVIDYAWEIGLRTEPMRRKGLMLKDPERPVDFYTVEEIQTLLEATEGTALGNIIHVGVNTGMRLGELLGLCWDKVDFGSEQIMICRTLHAKGRLQENTKGRRFRIFPLSGALLQFFRELKAKRISVGRHVFTDEDGNPICPDHFCQRLFYKACDTAGVRRLRFHDIRHTFASHFMMKGGNIFELQKLLGHSEIKDTMIYAHLTKDHLKRAATILQFAPRSAEEKNGGSPFMARFESGQKKAE